MTTWPGKSTWDPLNKCKSKLGILKKIRKYFTVEQFLKIVTTQYYSQLYYGGCVWFNTALKANLRGLVNTAHFRPLRIAVIDYQKALSKNELSKKCNRAKPIDWVRYSLATQAIQILAKREPFYLYENLVETLYTTRRKPLMGRFFDNSKGKIGRQKLCNKMQCMDLMTTNWLGLDQSKDGIRRTLKKTFFTHIGPQWLFIDLLLTTVA